MTTPQLGWNEIQFLSWEEFKQMAPSIVQLEITRLGTLMDEVPRDLDFHNALVRARFSLHKFVACLAEVEQAAFEASCAGYLRTALMSLPVAHPGLEADVHKTLNYIVDRLTAVHQRISLIY